MSVHPAVESTSVPSGGNCVWVVEVLDPDGAPIGNARITPDWAPAIESVNLERIRRHPSVKDLCAYRRGVIDPLYDAAARAPFIAGARVSLPLPDGGMISVEMPLEYFGELAQAAANQLVRIGKLTAGHEFLYQVCAYPRPESGDPTVTGMAVEELDQLLPLTVLDRASILAGAWESGPLTPGDIDVIIPASVLAETGLLGRNAGAVETGGFLIGNLVRDVESGDLFALVTAQVPAQDTLATATRLTFTPDCWTAASAAIAIRNSGEIMLGWWHTHPAAAWASSPEPGGGPEGETADRQALDAHTPFFSSTDCHLHRVCFSRAYQFGLVVTLGAKTLNWSLFGWRHGLVQHRHYYVIPGGAEEIENASFG